MGWTWTRNQFEVRRLFVETQNMDEEICGVIETRLESTEKANGFGLNRKPKQ